MLPIILLLVGIVPGCDYASAWPHFNAGPDENLVNYHKGIQNPNSTNTVLINDDILPGQWTWTVNVTDVANKTGDDVRRTYTSWSFSWPNTTAKLYEAVPSKLRMTWYWVDLVKPDLPWAGTCESAIGKTCVSELIANSISDTPSGDPTMDVHPPSSCIGALYQSNETFFTWERGALNYPTAENATLLWLASDTYASGNLTAYQNATNVLQVFMLSYNGTGTLYCNRASGPSAAKNTTSSMSAPTATTQTSVASSSTSGSTRLHNQRTMIGVALLLFAEMGFYMSN